MKTIVCWKLPIITCAELNKRSITKTYTLKTGEKIKKRKAEHWREAAARHKTQKERIRWEFRKERPSVAIPCDVRLTRIAPRALDVHDNLPASLKYICDALAECITGDYRPGRADDCEEIKWHYAQRKGLPREYAVLIEMEWDS